MRLWKLPKLEAAFVEKLQQTLKFVLFTVIDQARGNSTSSIPSIIIKVKIKYYKYFSGQKYNSKEWICCGLHVFRGRLTES